MQQSTVKDQIYNATQEIQVLFRQEPFFPTGEQSIDLRYDHRHLLLSVPNLSSSQVKVFFAELFRRYPELTTAKVAEMCKVSPRTVADWKQGTLRVKGETVAMLYRQIRAAYHSNKKTDEDQFLLERAEWLKEVMQTQNP